MQKPPVLKYELSAGGIVYRIINNQYTWLLIRHSKAGHWGFPKGHVADKVVNETLEAAAIREVQEEGGVIAEVACPQNIPTKYYFSSKEFLHKKTVHYFLMKYISGSTENHDSEVSDARFFPTEEVEKQLTYKSDRLAFQKALDILKKSS